jgi:hypothetical protein
VVVTTDRERLEAEAVVPDLSYVRFSVEEGQIRVRPAR